MTSGNGKMLHRRERVCKQTGYGQGASQPLGIKDECSRQAFFCCARPLRNDMRIAALCAMIGPPHAFTDAAAKPKLSGTVVTWFVTTTAQLKASPSRLRWRRCWFNACWRSARSPRPEYSARRCDIILSRIMRRNSPFGGSASKLEIAVRISRWCSKLFAPTAVTFSRICVESAARYR